MPSNPIIQAVFEAQRARLAEAEGRANLISTIRQQQRETTEAAMSKVREEAITAQQAQAQGRKEFLQRAGDAAKALTTVMPKPVAVRGDQQGISSGLSASSAEGISGLLDVAGGGAVQPASDQGGPTFNPDAFTLPPGQLGSDIQRTPGGGLVEIQRTPLRTGLAPVDLVNSLVGALRGGRPPLTTTTTQERLDLVAQERRLQLAQQAAQEKIVQREAKGTGEILFGIANGTLKDKSADVLKRLVDRFGPRMGGEIFRRGVREGNILAVEDRRAALKAGATAKAQGAEFEKRFQARPTTQARNREAQLQLKISRGEKLTKPEREFLDERQRASFEDRIVRSVLGGLGTGETSITPEAGGKELTPETFKSLSDEFESSLGRPATEEDHPAFNQFMKERGF